MGFASPQILRYETPALVYAPQLYSTRATVRTVPFNMFCMGTQFNPGTRGAILYAFAGNGRVLGFGVLSMAMFSVAPAYLV